MKSNNLNISKKVIILNKRYIIKEPIDEGASSKVYKCIDKDTGIPKAAKIFEKITLNSFEKEVNIMKKISEINSPSLMKHYESGIAFLTQNGGIVQKMYSILELGNHGSLFDAVFKTKNGFSEDVCKYMFSEILKGVEDLHKNGICHRDIKLENMILVGDNYEIKLCDFGFSTIFLDENYNKKKLDEFKGTYPYMAPELLERKKYEGDKIDIFSLGASLFVLLAKKNAFKKATIYNETAEEVNNLYALIKDKKYHSYWEILDNNFGIDSLSDNFKKLFVKMVAYDPKERPTIEQIKQDEWLKDVINATPDQMINLRNKMISEIEIQKT